MEKSRGNNYLRAILSIFIIQIIINILFRTDIDTSYYKYLWIGNQFVFLIAPLVYFYIKSLLDSRFNHSFSDIYHGIPCVLSLIFVIILALTSARFWKHPSTIPLAVVFLVQNIYYVYIIYQLLKQNGLSFKTFFIYIKDFRLSWVRYVTILYVMFWFIYFYIFVLGDMLHLIKQCPYYISLYALWSFIILNVIVYTALKKLDVFNAPQKYQKSNLKTDVKRDSLKKLEKMMDHDKVYLDPSLNLIGLAKKMSIAPCHLSQIINESFSKSFSSFVNSYRIKEGTQYLDKESQNKMNILEIAYATGFNSKSSFNSAFKKHMGLTPKEYRYQRSG